MKKRTLINILIVVGAICLMLGALVLRATIEGRSAASKAAADLATGRVDQAVISFDRALHWYLPGASHVRRSIDGLTAIAEKAESKGDAELALEAYRSLRSGLLASRSLYTPYPHVIDKCEERIAHLTAAKFAKDPNDPGYKRAIEWQRAAFKRYPGPDPFWATVAVLGFLGWAGAGLMLAFRAFPGEKGLAVRPFVVYGASLIVFYAVWILGMLKA